MTRSGTVDRTTRTVALCAAALAVALPPAALARWLRPDSGALEAQLATGLWLLKGLLAFHAAAALVVAGRLGTAAPPRHTSGVATRPEVRALAALLVLGIGLRIPGLDRGLWFDEIQTLVEYVRQPWSVLLTTFDSSNQHLLFSIAARGVRAVMGESAAALRMPAVLFGVASLWATLEFGKRWMPAREAWWAAALLTVSYHHVWFSQNARGYTGLLLGTLVTSTILVDMLRSRTPSQRQVWGYAVVMALTLLTHVTALVVMAGHGIAWLMAWRRLAPAPARWAPLAALTLGGTLAAMLYAPVMPQLVDALSTSGTASAGIEWKDPLWFLREAATVLSRGVPAGAVVLPVAGLVLIAGALSAWRAHPIAVVMVAAPPVVMAALLLASGHNLWPRFFFFAAAFIVQLAVHGGFAILHRIVPRHAVRIGDAGLVVVTVGSLLMLPAAWRPKQDYEATASWIAANARAGDRVVMTDMMVLPMERWLGKPWPVVTSAPDLERLEDPAGRTLVLYTFPVRLAVTAPDLWTRLEREYTIVHVEPATVGGGEIVVVAHAPQSLPQQ